MSRPLVSVIVPIYNAEKYLVECVESILAQTYEDIEVILVDDGSEDESSSICDAFADKDNRVVVHHKMNGGLVRARKTGIALAHGEYVCFVDADDWIKPEMVAYFVSNIGSADLITSGCEEVKGNGQSKIIFDNLQEGIYKTVEEKEYLYANMLTYEDTLQNGLMPFVWNKMYRTHILREVIVCVDDRIKKWEDRALLYPYVLQCNSIVVTKQSFYFYRYSDNSMIHSANTDALHNLNYLYTSLEKEFMKYEQRTVLMRQLQRFIIGKLYQMDVHMGFPKEMRLIKYMFPFANLLYDKRFVLYGAGDVGVNYYRQIKNRNEGKLLLWVDKNYESFIDSRFEVRPVEQILDVDFDCILIAVKRKEVAESIKKELLEKGIPEEKIWWKAPINIEGI